MKRDAYMGTGKRLGRESGSNPTTSRCPFLSSNFRQSLSQSIIGTKQLNVEGTDSGPPFLSHTRKRAGCSPSLVQEVGLRILRSMGSERQISLRTLPVGGCLAPYLSKRGYGVSLAKMGRN